MTIPESGFFSWLDVSRLGDSSDLCDYLIREARVAVNDGKAYGNEGAGHLRIVHGSLKDDQRAFDALERIAKALAKLSTE